MRKTSNVMLYYSIILGEPKLTVKEKLTKQELRSLLRLSLKDGDGATVTGRPDAHGGIAPQQFGNWKSVYTRHRCWCKNELWTHTLGRLAKMRVGKKPTHQLYCTIATRLPV
ncbi:MAG: hypothetical protein LBV12_03065 [Puniceicoccales bacterium]|nr:hypothetical protein [Puniceicoccales bacterium]